MRATRHCGGLRSAAMMYPADHAHCNYRTQLRYGFVYDLHIGTQFTVINETNY